MDIEVWSCLFMSNLLGFIDSVREVRWRGMYTHFLIQTVIMIGC